MVQLNCKYYMQLDKFELNRSSTLFDYISITVRILTLPLYSNVTHNNNTF